MFTTSAGLTLELNADVSAIRACFPFEQMEMKTYQLKALFPLVYLVRYILILLVEDSNTSLVKERLSFTDIYISFKLVKRLQNCLNGI